MTAYYNDNDAFCVAWLRNLIAAGHLPAGDVDDRPIQEVTADDVRGYDQCHFFAGIGGWAYALTLAGWRPDGRVWWTGSCPCQPFSAAGKGEAFTDSRHLWPEWFRLIRECKPPVIFGEQVAQAVRWGWLDLVSADLEGEGYAIGAAVLPACGVGAPHLRQRLWFVGHAASPNWRRTDGQSQRGGVEAGRGAPQPIQLFGDTGPTGGVADTDKQRGETECGPDRGDGGSLGTQAGEPSGSSSVTTLRNPWANLLWLPCRDRKARPTQPGLFPLAHGVPARVGKLRAYGNAIVPQVAQAFIEAYLSR